MLSELAKRLEEARDTVLAQWEARARRTVAGADRHASPVLLNGLPDVLDDIVRALAKGEPPPPLSPLDEHASDHGRQRATTTSFSLDQVLAEYGLLRQVLFEVVEQSGPLAVDDRDALLGHLEHRVRGSARAFVRVRDDERELARQELAAVNARLGALVKQRSEELSRTRLRFDILVEGVKDYSIFTVDPVGFITSWNKGAERMKGYTADEIVGAHFSILYPEEARLRDEPMSHLRAAAKEGRFRGEGLRQRKSGEAFLADVLITPMFEDGHLTGFSKLVQDLTERAALLQERDLLRGDAERLRSDADFREQFIASLSHDLRSPLSAAKTAAEIIVRGAASPETVLDLARRIVDGIDRADRMIVTLLDASRIEAGRPVKLALERCDLFAIASAVCADLAAKHGPRFRVLAEGTTNGVWNAEALRRVLENLLTNAVKYGSPGSLVTVRLRSRGGRVIMFVHNEGPPISLNDRARLFEPFRRGEGAEKGKHEGWGLGLAVVRGIVEALHGQVSVSSYPNAGTTFTVDLPVDSSTGES